MQCKKKSTSEKKTYGRDHFWQVWRLLASNFAQSMLLHGLSLGNIIPSQKQKLEKFFSSMS